jgi:hypothetical protein
MDFDVDFNGGNNSMTFENLHGFVSSDSFLQGEFLLVKYFSELLRIYSKFLKRKYL